MEGVQEGSAITASVERCWIHNCEFYAPSISNPAESDKAGGDGACDFKRGQYFTNSYCYYQGYHKTNLVGSSDSSLQYHLTYHHNYWDKCESRGPLARQANIHMYNNIFSGQTSYCMNPRANAYIFSEYNLFENCKNPMQVKLGAVKSYNDVLINCKGDMQGTVVTDKSTKVNTDCQYANFDTNSSVSYIPSGNYLLHTDTSKLAAYFDVYGGAQNADRTVNGRTSSDVEVQPQITYTKVDAKEATATKNGNTEYYIGSDGKFYVSENGNYREVPENSWVIPATGISNPDVYASASENAISLSWNTVNYAEKYAVAVLNNGSWQIVATTSGTSYTASGLKAGTSYTVAVIAQFDGSWNQDYSKAVTVSTTASSAGTYPTNIQVAYSEEYHQMRFTWDKVENAQYYGIAVYLAGKWRVQTQAIPATTLSYTTPKNLTPGKTYKVAIGAKVNGTWDVANAIKNAQTVTVR
jgi:hypothetical protein